MNELKFIDKYKPYRWTSFFNIDMEDQLTMDDFILGISEDNWEKIGDMLYRYPEWNLSTSTIEGGKIVIKPGNHLVNRDGWLLTDIKIPKEGVKIKW